MRLTSPVCMCRHETCVVLTIAAIQDNLRFELVNVLFNLAALYSQLAFDSNRAITDGLKSACSYFSSAAGVLSHIKDKLLPDIRGAAPPDMDVMTLESAQALMLAQAQECFWQKAVKDGLKDATISKLAAQVSDYYASARDWALKSQCITSEWYHHMSAKYHHFAAAAQYRAACDTLEKRKYGQEVARLRDSLASISEGLKESRYVSKPVIADMNSLKDRVTGDLKRAEKDNDMIYLNPVPSKSELPSLDRAATVSAKVPEEVEKSLEMLAEGRLGKPLFLKLVPYSVHIAASIYTDRRDQLVNVKLIGELEALNASIQRTLASLNLPGALQAVEKPLGLSPTVSAHAAEIRQQGGIHRLERAVVEIERLKDDDVSLYDAGVELLRTEAVQDEQSRRKYGTRAWQRDPSQEASPKLFAQVTEIQGYIDQAVHSDNTVQSKLKDNQSLIRLLGGTDRDLEDYIPSSRRVKSTPQVERSIISLRDSLNNLDRFGEKRRRRIAHLRTLAKADDVAPELLVEATRLTKAQPFKTIEAADFEDFFDERLEGYSGEQAENRFEAERQEDMLQTLLRANDAFNTARSGDTNNKDREEAIQRIENAYAAYNTIVSHLEASRKFYSELATIVTRFKDDCRAFVQQRRSEASQLETDIATSMQHAQTQRDVERMLAQQQRAQQAQRDQEIERERVRKDLQQKVQQREQAQREAEQAQRDQAQRVAEQGQAEQQRIAEQQQQRIATQREQRRQELLLAQRSRAEKSQRSEQPLAAPQPIRAVAPPRVPAEKSGGKGGVWTPEAGIKFG